MISIDILELVDRLEALVNNGWRVPFSTKAVVDESAFFDIIDQMRVSIPQEVWRAKELVQDKESVLTASTKDAEDIVEQARLEAAGLLDEHQLVAAARAEAENLKAQAQREAEGIRKGADDYAVNVLSELETRLSALLRTSSRGLTALKRRRSHQGPEQLEESS